MVLHYRRVKRDDAGLIANRLITLLLMLVSRSFNVIGQEFPAFQHGNEDI